MSLWLLYLIFRQVLGLVLLMGRTSATKDIELLVLRHEVAILRRTKPGPHMDWADRAVFAALVQRLPRALRCHRLSLPTRSCAGTAASSANDDLPQPDRTTADQQRPHHQIPDQRCGGGWPGRRCG